jgi:type II secretion system protein J
VRRQRGFTLIEVLVGIALLSALLAGIYAVAIGTLQARRKIQELSAVFTAGPRILDVIDHDIRFSYIHDVKDLKAFKAQRRSVEGRDATILDLVTTTNSKGTIEVDGRLLRADVTEIGYLLRGNELYRREQFLFDDDLRKGGKYFLVYDRVRSLTIDFHGAPDDGATTSSIAAEEGFEEWDSGDQQGLPRAARITLVLGPPAEVSRNLEEDDREFLFVRWVLLPSAYDKAGDEVSGPHNPPYAQVRDEFEFR